MIQRSRNIFTKGLSADADLRFVENGDWIKSHDIINYGIGDDGAVKVMRGNAEVDLAPISLPAGTNTCIGSREDEHSKSAVWMNHNSNSQHGIYRYWYETGRVDEVIIHPEFDFEIHRKIHDIAIVDGRYLIWTDVLAAPVELGGKQLSTSEGKQPRCVDMERATLLGGTIEANTGLAYKALGYDIFLHYNDIADSSTLPNTISIQIQLLNIDMTVVLLNWTQIVQLTAMPEVDFATWKQNVYNEIALALQGLGMSAEDKRDYCHVVVPALNGGRRLRIQVLENNQTSLRVFAMAAPTNHYMFPYVDAQFDLAKPMPSRPLTVSCGKTSETSIRHITKQSQFTYRYIFFDGSRSAWAPYSSVPLNIEYDPSAGTQAVAAVNQYNITYLTIPDELLDQEWIGFVKKVEFGVRHADNYPFMSIGEYNLWDINDEVQMPLGGRNQNLWKIVYKENQQEYNIGSDEDTPTGQAFKLFDYIPTRVNALGMTTDEKGDARMVIGGEVFGYENPIVKATLEVRKDTGVTTVFPIAGPVSKYTNTSKMYFKKGGRYGIGIAYYDDKGKTPGVVKIGEVRIPYNDGVEGFHYVRVNFDTPPPSWAKTWRICRTKNLRHQIYRQFPAWQSRKAKFVGTTGVGLWTGDQRPDSDQSHYTMQIGILAQKNIDEKAHTVELFDFTGQIDQGVTWIPERNHRLQIVAMMYPCSVVESFLYTDDPKNPQGFYGAMRPIPNGSLDEAQYNFRVVGYMISESETIPIDQAKEDFPTQYEDTYRVITAILELEGNPTFLDYDWLKDLQDNVRDPHAFIVEIYKENDADNEEFMYETPVWGYAYPNTHLPEGDPQRIDIKEGDTAYHSPFVYRLGQWPTGTGWADIRANSSHPSWQSISDAPFKNWYFEMPTQYDPTKPYCSNIGRPVIIDRKSREEYNYQRVRISDAYIPATHINGLASFRGLSYIDINVDYGPIMTIKSTRDDIAVVCWNKIQLIYVGKGRVLQLDGNEQVGRSTSLLTLARPLIEDIGTQHPESIASDGRRIWGVDKRVGVVWRYSNDGITVLSDKKNRKYFHDIFLATESSYTTHLYILGGWNPRINMYFFTITEHVLKADKRESVSVPARTFGWSEADNEWKDEFSLVPEMYGTGGIHMLVWENGRLWLSDQTETNFPTVASVPPGNYFGVQYAGRITFVVNKDPADIKVWLNLRQQSNLKWTAPEITIPINDTYRVGQLSRLKSANIHRREGMFVADFLRDMSDPAFSDIVNPVIRQATALLRGRVLRGEIIVVTLEASTPDCVLVSVDTEFFKSEKT